MRKEKMLEDLDAIDWSKLICAYGNATIVPTFISALASPSPEIWEDALQKLRSCLLHQGHMYEATTFAVPFFIELLEYDIIQCKGELLQDLGYIGFAAGECSSPDPLYTRLYDAIARGSRTYLKLLKGGDPKIRMYALYTLDALQEQVPENLFLIYTHFLQETDPRARAGFVVYLSSRMHFFPEGEDLLNNLLYAEEEHLLVKVLAALMQVQNSKEQTPRKSIQILLNTLVHPDTLDEGYAVLPWRIHNDLVSTISDFLPHLGDECADLIIPALLERLKYLDQCFQARSSNRKNGTTFDVPLIKQDYAVLSIVRTLFHFAFQKKQLQANAVPFLLTVTQRAVLTAILTCNVAGHFTDRIAEYLDELGLPYRWELQALLQLQ